jgi:hypothetical protein
MRHVITKISRIAILLTPDHFPETMVLARRVAAGEAGSLVPRRGSRRLSGVELGAVRRVRGLGVVVSKYNGE